MYLEPSIDAVVAAVRSLDLAPGRAVMLLVAERDAPDLEQLVSALTPLRVPFFGGLFPAVLDGGALHERGVALLEVPVLGEPVLVDQLADAERVLSDLWRRLPGPEVPRPTAVVFVDGLAPDISAFLATCYSELGATVTWIGGGAGSASLERRPCIFGPGGVHQGAAVVALTPWSCDPGVRHGWRRAVGPMAATRTERNRIVELNWRPAFDVYREALEGVGVPVTQHAFAQVAMRHPFGLFKEGREAVVRDPVAVDADGALQCVGEVPENAVLTVLGGDRISLVQAAGQAAHEALPLPGVTVRARLVVDCISRSMYLQDGFDEELDAIVGALGGPAGSPLVGALTLGEIGSRGDGYLDLLNKTAVVGVLHER